MKYIFLILLSLNITSCFSAKGLPTNSTTEKLSNKDSVQTINHETWNLLLQKHVSKKGNVNYKAFLKDKSKLDAYISYLEDQSPKKTWSKNKLLAYYINLYNAVTVQLILQHYPISSIKDLKNPWGKNRVIINESNYSLNDIEHGILRKMDEPRIHFAVNCASASCPKLINQAFTSKNVNFLLDEASKEFINNPFHNKITSNEIKLSKIFKWYKGDFTEQGSLIDYLNQYSSVKISEDAKINYKDYDWNLNDKN